MAITFIEHKLLPVRRDKQVGVKESTVGGGSVAVTGGGTPGSIPYTWDGTIFGIAGTIHADTITADTISAGVEFIAYNMNLLGLSDNYVPYKNPQTHYLVDSKLYFDTTQAIFTSNLLIQGTQLNPVIAIRETNITALSRFAIASQVGAYSVYAQAGDTIISCFNHHMLFSIQGTGYPGSFKWTTTPSGSEVYSMVLSATGRLGIGFSEPEPVLAVNGGVHIGGYTYVADNNLLVDGISYFVGNVLEPNFNSGWQGTNWRIEPDGDAEFNNVLIRGGLQVYELIINQLHYQNGGLIIGAGSGKLKTISSATPGSEQMYFESPEGTLMSPFSVGAIVMVQRVDINRTTVVKKLVRQVSAVQADMRIDLTTTAGWTTGNDTGVFELGDEVCAIGHVSNTDLDSSIYISAIDSNNPFMRVYDGVNSLAKFNLGDKTTIKLQLGNLESLAGYSIVPASPGYGLFSDNVYLTGVINANSGLIGGFTINSTEGLYSGAAATRIQLKPGTGIWLGADAIANAPFSVDAAGAIKAVSGLIGGWSLATDAIYTGVKKVSDGYSTSGVTFAANGGIHAKKFYVNSNGDMMVAGFEIPHLIAKVASDTVRNTHNAIATNDNTTPIKLKTITITNGMLGTARWSFELKATLGYTAYAQIYRNGSAIGTQQSTSIDSYQYKSEDFAINWIPGDTAELYVWSSAEAIVAYVQNFAMRYDNAAFVAVPTVNT